MRMFMYQTQVRIAGIKTCVRRQCEFKETEMQKKMIKAVVRSLLVAMLCAGAASAGYGQSAVDGAIGGTVQDSSGLAIPKATVVIRNNATNAEQTAVTDDSGFFRAIHLQPSTYTVTVTAAGFE